MTLSRVLHHPQLRDREAPLLFTFAGSTRHVPLIAGAGLFAGSILLSLFGPIDWRMDNAAEVYAFLVACLVALVAGYVWAVRQHNERPVGGRWPLPQASLIVVLGSVIYLLLYPLTVYDSTGNWFPNVVEGLTNPGKAYADKTAAALEIPQTATYLGMIVAPLTMSVLPLTLFFWPRLSRLARVLGVTVNLLALTLGVSRAVNQDVGELCGYIVLFLLLVASTVGPGGAVRRKRILACTVGAALVSGLFLSYYHVVISGRVSADTAAAEAEAEAAGHHARRERLDDALRTTALASVGRERRGSVFYSVLPAAAQPTGSLFTSYLTQGYKGLSIAMDSRWHPTYGLGFSIFVRHNASRVLGLDEESVEERTYEGQLDAVGWTAGTQWSTFFIHPASDITFLGVIPFLGLIGFAFGAAWRDSCRRADPVACVVFFYLGVQVLYLSANNQLYQGGARAIGFTVVLVAWLLLRARPRPGRAPRPGTQMADAPVGEPAGVRGNTHE